MEWIGRPLKPPSSKEYGEDDDKEEDVGDPLASTEYGFPVDEDDEVRENNQEEVGIYDRKYTVLYDVEDNKEEAALEHEGESSLSGLLVSSDDEDEDDNRTSAKDINYCGNGNGGF